MIDKIFMKICEILAYFLFFVIICIIFLGLISFIDFIYNEYQFSKLPIITQECQLLGHNFLPSTQKTRVAPVFYSDGSSSMAVYTSENRQKKITVWMCGKYGRIICDNERVYQYAKENSILYIRSNHYDTRIIDIEAYNELD